VPLIPKHTVYVEPFAGGLAILFAKPTPKITSTEHYREVINDKDAHLINFYRQLRDHGDELIRLIELTPYSELEYELSKDLGIDDDMERARRYFVNISQSFASKLNGGWGRGKFGRNLAVTYQLRVDNLHAVLNRLKGVHMACDDAIKVIKDWDSPQTLFYCDPPYPNTHMGHYKGYTIQDYDLLITTLNQCEGSFILSNYAQNIPIPDEWEVFSFDATMTATKAIGSRGNAKRTEMVYRRLNRVPVRDEIQRIYDSPSFSIFRESQKDMLL
jgi:DNA adenine methylase